MEIWFDDGAGEAEEEIWFGDGAGEAEEGGVTGVGVRASSGIRAKGAPTAATAAEAGSTGAAFYASDEAVANGYHPFIVSKLLPFRI